MYQETDNEIDKLINNIDKVQNKHVVYTSDFLLPYMVKKGINYIQKLNNSGDSLSFFVVGEKEGYERQKLIVFHDYVEFDNLDEIIGVLRVDYNQKFNQIAHKDVLGALLKMGLSRSKIGDIIINEDIYVIVDANLKDYLRMNLTKIGRGTVSLVEVPVDQLPQSDIVFENVSIVVNSLRLDSVISHSYPLSRAKAQNLILGQQVKVNHQIVTDKDCPISIGDLISVRRHGRFKILSFDGKTKKDKFKIIIGKYV